jgi:hypothetical protein
MRSWTRCANAPRKVGTDDEGSVLPATPKSWSDEGGTMRGRWKRGEVVIGPPAGVVYNRTHYGTNARDHQAGRRGSAHDRPDSTIGRINGVSAAAVNVTPALSDTAGVVRKSRPVQAQPRHRSASYSREKRIQSGAKANFKYEQWIRFTCFKTVFNKDMC